MTLNSFGDLTPAEASAMHDRLAADMPGCAEWTAERVGERSVLDYGCGAGVDCRFYSPRQYIGIDVSVPLLDEARRRYPAHDFRHVGDAPENADCVIFKAMIEHLPTVEDARAVLAHALRIAPVIYVAWHTPPASVEILRQVVGTSGRTFPQNTFALADIPFTHSIERLGAFELWTVTR